MNHENFPFFTFFTWNIAANLPLPDLSSVFHKLIVDFPDLIFIALQELDECEFIETNAPQRYDQWTELISGSLSSEYKIVFKERCGAVCFYALQKSTTQFSFKLIESQSGLFPNAQENKAFIMGSFSLQINSSEVHFSVVGTHFQAFHEEYNERNKEWLGLDSCHSCGNYSFLMGDLNYRVELPYENAVKEANADNYQELLKHDQLKRAQREIQAFAKYKEPEIKFRPTYKYDLNSNQYDTSYKQRTPSYTDRILVKTANGTEPPIFVDYNRIEDTFSDHRPVFLKVRLPII